MMTVEDCMRAAFNALLEGDLAKRDHFCAMATNLMAIQDRLDKGYPPNEAVLPDVPICLPDRSKEKPQ